MKLASPARLFLASLLIWLGLSAAGCQDPPQYLVDQTDTAIERAADAGALRYAEKTYRRAEELFLAGRQEMARQKGRLAPLRDFRVADSLLNLSLETANEAANATRSRIDSLVMKVLTEHDGLRTRLKDYREALDGSFTIINAERYWASAELALQTSERLLGHKEYEAAIQAIGRAKDSLAKLSRVLDDYANDTAQKLHQSRAWVKQTVDTSRESQTTAIVVDKAAHKLYLVQSGKVVRTFDCDLGYNSSKQKFFVGDGATPEGLYHVTEERHTGSKYYKALMLSYPNDHDKQRFTDNKRKGLISKRARIGALIEIHGDGGRGKDWTEGCVALTNQEMDYLMKYASVGTPVTIVRRSDMWP